MVAMVEIDQTALQAIQDKARSVIQAAMQTKDSGGIESLRSAIEDGKLKGLDEKADLAPAPRLWLWLGQKLWLWLGQKLGLWFGLWLWQGENDSRRQKRRRPQSENDSKEGRGES